MEDTAILDDKVLDDQVLEPKAEVEAEEAPLDPEIEEAKALGWKPKEEYEGDPDYWENHKKFLKTKQIFNKLDERSKEIFELKKSFHEYKKHMQSVTQKQLDAEIARLKAQQREAKENFDFDGYDRTGAAIKDLERIIPQEADDTELQPYVKRIQEELAPLMQSKRHIAAIQEIEKEVQEKYPNLTYAELCDRIITEAKNEFSHKFDQSGKEPRPKSAPTIGVRTVSTAKSNVEDTFSKLSPQQKRQYEHFAKYISKEEFIKDLKDAGAL